jgi:hypothetical protein
MLLSVYSKKKKDRIEELANTPNKGNLSNAPYNDMNSPTKFKVRGTHNSLMKI